MVDSYDFCGWATKNDLECTDGRTIRRDAFKDQDGQKVPLVWNHQHNNPENVLGHAILENRADGVYAYCKFNNTDRAEYAKEQVIHGDIDRLSIWANKLKQKGGNVFHGVIREVSLVLAGANPGATIDLVLAHSEDGMEEEGIIVCGEEIVLAHACNTDDEEKKPERKDELEMADKTAKPETENSEETVADVFNTLTEKQKKVVYALIGQAIQDAKNEAKHAAMEEDEDEDDGSDSEETVAEVFNTLSKKQKTAVYAIIGQALEDAKNGGNDMKHNVFENDEMTETLSHDAMDTILGDAKKYGSLKESFLAHADDYGIENIEYLFPDAKTTTNVPSFLKRPDGWVRKVMSGVGHTPFSRVKTVVADITESDARARGYLKGNRKYEEVFSLLKRTTDPTTVYKKQKIDRDDQIDITDFDVVSFIKTEMRGMLDEELARAFLIGDGRSLASEDKIDETKIRPIYKDDQLFVIRKAIAVSGSETEGTIAKKFIREAIKARKDYRGSGNVTLYTTEDMLTDMLMIEDTTGRVIYDSMEKLCTALRVKEIVTVPVMDGVSRVSGTATLNLMGIFVNLADYNVGADKGGSVNMFDDFDIDYNAMKYLIETRCSGALTVPYSAIVIESSESMYLDVEPEDAGTTILGKSVSDLQSGILINDDFISGTLKYVTGYTGYSGDPDLQKGNFLALQFDAPDAATTTVELLGGHSGPIELDSDMNAVVRIENRNQKIKVTSVADGLTITKTYGLRQLKLTSAN